MKKKKSFNSKILGQVYSSSLEDLSEIMLTSDLDTFELEDTLEGYAPYTGCSACSGSCSTPSTDCC